MNHLEQLELDFSKKREAFLAAAEEYNTAAEALIKEANRKKRKETYESLKEDREVFNRLVKHLAVAKYQRDFHTAYIVVYDKLHQLTGYHPCWNATSRAAHLEDVCVTGHLKAAITAVKTLIAPEPA